MSNSTPKIRIHYLADVGAMALKAAAYLLAAAREAISARGRFSLVLAGGRTPKALYLLLAASPLVEKIDWGLVQIFQSDERCLPPHHPSSNFHLAATTLLAPGLIPASNVHRMRGEAQDLNQAALDYQREIEENLGDRGFDLVLLGMGEDGHIASLFPGSPLLAEQERLVAALSEPSGDPSLPRLTLTLPAINGADKALLLISGHKKRLILEEIMVNERRASQKYPAALVKPRQELTWLVVD